MDKDEDQSYKKVKPSAPPSSEKSTKKQRDPFVRAANEDDDGYDPWSDRQPSNPLWEEDPWR